MSPVIKHNWLIRGLILGSLASSLIIIPAFAGSKGVVTGSNVNVRTSNSLDSTVYTQLNTGYEIDIEDENGDYYKINYENSNYYISKDFVSIEKATGKINAFSVNIRKYPSTNHEVLSQADSGETFEVVGKTGEWVNILFNGESAFVHKDFIDVPMINSLKTVTVVEPVIEEGTIGLVAPAPLEDEFYAVVTSANGLKLREFPSVDSNVLTVYTEGTTVDILADYGDWVKVCLGGIEGYMSSDFVSIKEGKRPENSMGQQITDYARKFLGTPYVWGGTSLNKGVDCSGFVYSVMKNFGISLNRSSRDQYKNGYSISKSNLLVGDLVFFDTDRNGGISHVGIYIGNGQFIHSSSSRKTYGVTISSLYDEYYSRTYYGACRIL